MNKKIIITGVSSFIAGAGIGFFVSKVLFKKEVRMILDDLNEISKEPIDDYLNSFVDEINDTSEVEKNGYKKDDTISKIKRKKTSENIAYNKMYGSSKTSNVKKEVDFIKDETSEKEENEEETEEYDPDDMDDPDNYNLRSRVYAFENMSEDISVIEEAEYRLDLVKYGYDVEDLDYYQYNNTLVNKETGEVIQDPEKYIGDCLSQNKWDENQESFELCVANIPEATLYLIHKKQAVYDPLENYSMEDGLSEEEEK